MTRPIDLGTFPVQEVVELVARARAAGWCIAAGGFAVLFDTGEKFLCPMGAAALEVADLTFVDAYDCGIATAPPEHVVDLAARRLNVTESVVQLFTLGFDWIDLTDGQREARIAEWRRHRNGRDLAPEEEEGIAAGKFMRSIVSAPTLAGADGRIELPSAPEIKS